MFICGSRNDRITTTDAKRSDYSNQVTTVINLKKLW